ncbi:MAG: HD domain-containing protein [Lachnospiraceae bacterium]|nr:HD domain-containing protein [Lachnospiraceae bacterium]
MQRQESLNRYIEQTLDIRALSSPQVQDMEDAEEYRLELLRSFTRIGSIGQENNEILRTHWLPLIRSEDALVDEDRDALNDFSRSLLDAYRMENLDLPMRFKQTRRLLKDALSGDDDDVKVCALDSMVEASFAMMHMVQRLVPCDGSCYQYRDEGLEAAGRLLSYLEPEKFTRLKNEESRHLVLTNSRYISALFDRSDHYCDEINAEDFETMRRALSLAEDPFYRKAAPGYNWLYHRFRTLQYITNFTELNNVRGFRRDELEEIYEDTMQLAALWEAEEETLAKHCTRELIELYRLRIEHLTGRVAPKEYKDRLSLLIQDGDTSLFTLHGNMIHALALNEYLLAVDRDHPDRDDAERLNRFYRSLVQYVHRMPKKGSFSFLLTFLSDFLKSYVDVPGAPEFEEICLMLMVALHPPTYVHSLSVADFTRCITKHLIRTQPSRLVGILGCADAEDVRRRQEELLGFAYHSGLCHDVGKLFVTETILNYGRMLFQEEFDLIRVHPAIGAYVLSAHEKTAPYANIALLHHQWHDGTTGYPLSPKASTLAEKAMIDIVACADCLDASTDIVGRSYKRGVMLEDFLQELHAGSGTRYAPYLAELLEDPEVYGDVAKILTEGRDENYRKAYEILWDRFPEDAQDVTGENDDMEVEDGI